MTKFHLVIFSILFNLCVFAGDSKTFHLSLYFSYKDLNNNCRTSIDAPFVLNLYANISGNKMQSAQLAGGPSPFGSRFISNVALEQSVIAKDVFGNVWLKKLHLSDADLYWVFNSSDKALLDECTPSLPLKTLSQSEPDFNFPIETVTTTNRTLPSNKVYFTGLRKDDSSYEASLYWIQEQARDQ